MEINADTKTCILIGNPVSHSLSPQLHNSAFKELGLNWAYYACHVEKGRLTDAINGIRALNIRGANVTIPYKESVIPLLDQVDPQAKAIGAVNTIVNMEGKLVGYNTDGEGFFRSVEEAGFKPSGKKITIIGAGGSAKAVAVSFAMNNASELTIVNRRAAAAKELKGAIEGISECSVNVVDLKDDRHVAKHLYESSLLVHTTPNGMFPHVDAEPLIASELLHPDLLVADLIYNPVETSLLKAAKGRGCGIVSGLGMLLYQGALAFEKWTGVSPPVEHMKSILIKE